MSRIPRRVVAIGGAIAVLVGPVTSCADRAGSGAAADAPRVVAVPATVAPGSPAPAPAAAGADTADAAAPTVLEGPAAECPTTAHGVIVDRATQRAWLCGDGAVVVAVPITSAWSMPDPGSYPVYAKDLDATSTLGGHDSRMTHFVAFSYGERTGARVAFHSVPTLPDGTFVQPLDTVGQLGVRGETSGCIRVLPEDAVRLWDWLALGDEVHVIS
jgi:hypothetical protein